MEWSWILVWKVTWPKWIRLAKKIFPKTATPAAPDVAIFAWWRHRHNYTTSNVHKSVKNGVILIAWSLEFLKFIFSCGHNGYSFLYFEHYSSTIFWLLSFPSFSWPWWSAGKKIFLDNYYIVPLVSGPYSRYACLESYSYINMYKTCGDVSDYVRNYIPQHIIKK